MTSTSCTLAGPSLALMDGTEVEFLTLEVEFRALKDGTELQLAYLRFMNTALNMQGSTIHDSSPWSRNSLTFRVERRGGCHRIMIAVLSSF